MSENTKDFIMAVVAFLVTMGLAWLLIVPPMGGVE